MANEDITLLTKTNKNKPFLKQLSISTKMSVIVVLSAAVVLIPSLFIFYYSAKNMLLDHELSVL
jgi:hypothetical protein